MASDLTARDPFDMPTSGIPEEQERALNTAGLASRYHELLNLPYSVPFNGRGYIIGIEKAHATNIGYPIDTYYDHTRLIAPKQAQRGGDPLDVAQEQKDFKHLFKRWRWRKMFVSHIIGYGPSRQDLPLVQPEQIYSAYSGTSLKSDTSGEPAAITGDAYEQGWAALDGLQDRLIHDIETAKAAGHPFTHIQVMSMGWNNDQFEALERYNDLVAQTKVQADGEAYNPLVIGITWPSVWKLSRQINVGLGHIASYLTKCRDADQIGYGIMNALINRILPEVENASGLRSVLIGHSMGARLLTRAYLSAHVLQGAVTRQGQPPLVIGLQGAFDAFRFHSNPRQKRRARLFGLGEGAPYRHHAQVPGQIVLTWSDRDRANPFARYATGAHHVGGGFGDLAFRTALPQGLGLQHSWTTPKSLKLACDSCQQGKQILFIDASWAITSHGDIRDPQIGQIIATLLKSYNVI